MTREEAIFYIKELQKTYASKDKIVTEAVDMAIEALQADATVAKIQIDDIDKAKTSSQLLDDLAVDIVNALGKRIVEVVRCKDCKYCEWDKDGGWCILSAHRTKTTDYCSWGERKDGADMKGGNDDDQM